MFSTFLVLRELFFENRALWSQENFYPSGQHKGLESNSKAENKIIGKLIRLANNFRTQHNKKRKMKLHSTFKSLQNGSLQEV